MYLLKFKNKFYLQIKKIKIGFVKMWFTEYNAALIKINLAYFYNSLDPLILN